MPIYEYRCRNGHTFEVLQRFSDDPVTKCQVCGAAVERVFHPVAVHFKGSGFYNTDYGTRKRSRELKEAAGESSSNSSQDGSGKDGTGGKDTKDTKDKPAGSGSDSGSSQSKSDSGAQSAKKSESKS